MQDDARRNIVLTNFGFNAGGTFDLLLSNFTVPDQIVSTQSEREARKTDQLVRALPRLLPFQSLLVI